ncbi:hypothetical protein HDE_04129 [Halotydeus destructor]|nr:hypothetical protein HDE_04129 [Halotydeus destructor]
MNRLLLTIQPQTFKTPYEIMNKIELAKDRLIKKVQAKEIPLDYVTLPKMTSNKMGRISVENGKSRFSSEIKYDLPPDVLHVLGLADDGIKVVPDVTGGRRALVVHCDIVDHSVIGDSLQQVLRVIPVDTTLNFGDQVTHHFAEPNIIPVSVRKFKTIEIQIKDDVGKLFPLRLGRVYVTLHFRKR